MYNTAFDAYIKMMSDPAFKGNSGNYEHEKNARAEIANWAEIGGKDDLKKQIEEFETDLKAAADKANGIAKTRIVKTMVETTNKKHYPPRINQTRPITIIDLQERLLRHQLLHRPAQ